jgi:hypothetical protein
MTALPKGTGAMMKAESTVSAMVLVSARDVQRKYGVSTAEQGRWRRLGIGPDYYQPLTRIIRYDIGDVDDWFNDPGNAHLHDFPVEQTTNPRET